MAELAKRSGINPAHLGRIENGLRPPTVRVADALDKVFERLKPALIRPRPMKEIPIKKRKK